VSVFVPVDVALGGLDCHAQAPRAEEKKRLAAMSLILSAEKRIANEALSQLSYTPTAC
jgi:hypothetical protein